MEQQEQPKTAVHAVNQQTEAGILQQFRQLQFLLYLSQEMLTAGSRFWLVDQMNKTATWLLKGKPEELKEN